RDAGLGWGRGETCGWAGKRERCGVWRGKRKDAGLGWGRGETWGWAGKMKRCGGRGEMWGWVGKRERCGVWQGKGRDAGSGWGEEMWSWAGEGERCGVKLGEGDVGFRARMQDCWGVGSSCGAVGEMGLRHGEVGVSQNSCNTAPAIRGTQKCLRYCPACMARRTKS
uniref:Uncharacterized protein n=1 Tax=Pelusios castaneus TaxID=367368 RepID=A0A8C8VMB5_9SAUR